MPILKGTAGNETDKAISFRAVSMIFSDGKSEVILYKPFQSWFPHSQITKIVRSPHSEQDEIHISDWIAEKKGLYDEFD